MWGPVWSAQAGGGQAGSAQAVPLSSGGGGSTQLGQGGGPDWLGRGWIRTARVGRRAGICGGRVCSVLLKQEGEPNQPASPHESSGPTPARGEPEHSPSANFHLSNASR